MKKKAVFINCEDKRKPDNKGVSFKEPPHSWINNDVSSRNETTATSNSESVKNNHQLTIKEKVSTEVIA